MNIQTMTPVEIDTRLADLYMQELRAEKQIEHRTAELHYALRERREYITRTRSTWPTSDTRALEIVREKAAAGEDVPLSAGRGSFVELAAKFDKSVAELAAVLAEQKPFHDEFTRRGGWSRFFVVQNHNGHVHESMDCSTCNRNGARTEFGWNPKLSGLGEAEAVAVLGPQLCTVCFPSAPVEWTIGKVDTGHCDGGSAVDVVMNRRTWRSDGTCPACGYRSTVSGSGKVRKHKPATKDAQRGREWKARRDAALVG